MRIKSTTALIKINGKTYIKEVRHLSITNNKLSFFCDNTLYTYEGDLSNYKDLMGQHILDCQSLKLISELKLSYL